MVDDLCLNLISKIAGPPIVSSSLSSRLRAPRLIQSDPLDTGGTTRFQRNSLFCGTEEQFSLWLDDTMNRMLFEALDFNDLRSQQDLNQRRGWRELARQFLGDRTDRPVLAWVTPVWFLMTTTLPAEAEILDRSSFEEAAGAPTTARGEIALSCGRTRLSIPIRLFRAALFYPREDRGGNPKITRLGRTRAATLQGKSLFKNVREDAIMLARPGDKNDDFWLNKGKVPVEEGFWTNFNGPARLNFCTMTIAKLYPDRDHRDALVEQLTFAVGRNGQTVGIRGSIRPFGVFLQHHFRIRDAIMSVL